MVLQIKHKVLTETNVLVIYCVFFLHFLVEAASLSPLREQLKSLLVIIWLLRGSRCLLCLLGIQFS
ncbi:hypothetical protein V6Z11_D02G216600 [Gossypium hirsutum]